MKLHRLQHKNHPLNTCNQRPTHCYAAILTVLDEVISHVTFQQGRDPVRGQAHFAVNLRGQNGRTFAESGEHVETVYQ